MNICKVIKSLEIAREVNSQTITDLLSYNGAFKLIDISNFSIVFDMLDSKNFSIVEAYQLFNILDTDFQEKFVDVIAKYSKYFYKFLGVM